MPAPCVLRECVIGRQGGTILGRGHGRVGLVVAGGEPRVLANDDGLVRGIAVGALGVEVLELVDTGVRRVRVGVVHDAGALEVPDPEHLLLEVEGSRSEEHTSELQSLMRISYAVFCLKKTTNSNT